MSDSEYNLDSPLSQFSIEDDEIVWSHSSSFTNTDFVVLRHPLRDTRSLPSNLDSDGDLSSALDKLSLCDRDSSSTSAESDGVDDLETGRISRKTKRRAESSSASSASSVTSPTASYDDASAFISRFISSPVKANSAELDLLRALIIELGLRSSSALDLPCTLTSARKILKAEAHVNIKEYIATRHKGQSALREILKPSKNALRKELRKGNKASLQWVKQQGLQILLVTCFT